jgi:exodeoxyribonuclease VII small subunit
LTDAATDGEIGDGPGYAAAMAELEAILRELEDGEIDIDRLAEQVRRAADLVRVCRGRLTEARTEVTRIVAELDGSGATGFEEDLDGAADPVAPGQADLGLDPGPP